MQSRTVSVYVTYDLRDVTHPLSPLGVSVPFPSDSCEQRQRSNGYGYSFLAPGSATLTPIAIENQIRQAVAYGKGNYASRYLEVPSVIIITHVKRPAVSPEPL